MKTMKKLLALVAVLVMVFAMSTTAFAAGNGEITVNGTTDGKTYDIYKIFDLTLTADGSGYSYTVDPDWENFFFNGGPGAVYLTPSVTPGASTLTYDGMTYYIRITDANVAQFAQSALEYAATKPNDGSKTADASGSVKFTGLDLGYYLVFPQGASEIKNGYGSICSLTSTDPSATVNVKADYPTIEKTVIDPSGQVGEKVTFTITGKVPDTTGYTTYTYEVKDTMTSGLTFNASVSEFSVRFGNTPIIVTPIYTTNGFTLNFDMVQYQQYKGQTITITYKAVVNKDAVVTITQNEATLTYSNDPQNSNSKETTPPDIVDVYSSKIVVDKHDANNVSKKLKDASFVLMKRGNNMQELFYKYDAATDTVSWVINENDATVMTTDVNGAAEFIGLEDGKYFLRETAAPAGYNLLDHDIEVDVQHTTTTVGGQTRPIGVSLTQQIANNSGTVLPSTGGIGTTIFYALGAVLVAGAGIILVVRRRMKNAQN